MPPGRNERAEPAEHRAGTHENPHASAPEPRQLEPAAVLDGKIADSLSEIGQAPENDDSGQQPATQAVENSRVKEWTSNERVRSADELGDLDLGSALLDLQPHGVADHSEDAQPKHAH